MNSHYNYITAAKKSFIGKMNKFACIVPVCCVFLTLCLLLPSAARARSLVLVENGRPLSVVVTADDPSPTAEFAAEELVRHVELATGAKMEVAPESAIPADPAGRIFVGVTQAALDAGINPDTLEPDEALLRAIDDNLFILGRENDEDPLSQRNNHAGTLFGVYEFLERSLDVRWLWPGELGTYAPRTDMVSVPANLDRRYKPQIPHRHIWNTIQHTNYRTGAERNAYRQDRSIHDRRHRLGQTETAPSPAHGFRDAGDGKTWWERYGEEHPEWFAMDGDGERDGRRGMCVSNPDLHEYIADRYKQYLEKGFEGAPRAWRNGPEWIVLGDLDSSWRPCQCDDCREWDGPIPDDPSFGKGLYDRFGWFGASDRYARFYQTIYEKAAEHNPDVKVSGYLYWSYFPAPTTDLDISPNVYGHYCPWGTGGIIYFPISEEALEWKKEQWRGWRDTGMSMIYRPNHWNGGYVMPHITWQGGEFFRWAAQNDMAGFKFDKYTDHWAVKGPMLYMYLRLFANPDREIEDILNQYYEAFGPAAEHIRDYFNYWEEYSRTRPGGTLFHSARAAIAFPEEVFQPAENKLERALTAARRHPRSEYADRVRFLWKGFEHARLTSRFWDSLEIEAANRANIPEEPEARAQAVKAFMELEAFRHRYGDEYIANFGEALEKREERSVDIEKLRELSEAFEAGNN